MPNDRLQTAIWIGFGLAGLWLLYRLGPILSPFLLAGILAYIGNPLVEQLSRRGVPRTGAVLLVMILLALAVALLVLAVAPLVRDEMQMIVERLPDLYALIADRVLPWIQEHTGLKLRLKFSPVEVRQFVGNNWSSVQAVLQKLFDSALFGGHVLFQLGANLILAPVAMFYLMRDWHGILRRIEHVIPRPWHDKAVELAAEVDHVLAEFLRGQLLVMALLAGYYAIALWAAGIDFALPLGLITGLLIFVPYLGFATGITLAVLVALLQLDGWQPVIGVLVVYGVGQVVESIGLTPLLVGERIGLHPLAVIFALLAFGELFGFFGILLALPVSAIILVGLRHLRSVYLASSFYRGPAS